MSDDSQDSELKGDIWWTGHGPPTTVHPEAKPTDWYLDTDDKGLGGIWRLNDKRKWVRVLRETSE